MSATGAHGCAFDPGKFKHDKFWDSGGFLDQSRFEKLDGIGPNSEKAGRFVNDDSVQLELGKLGTNTTTNPTTLNLTYTQTCKTIIVVSALYINIIIIKLKVLGPSMEAIPLKLIKVLRPGLKLTSVTKMINAGITVQDVELLQKQAAKNFKVTYSNDRLIRSANS